MQLALAYHAGDADQCQRWLDWNDELGGTERHDLFLMPAKGAPEMASSFSKWNSHQIVRDAYGVSSNWNGDASQQQSASGPNSMFRQFAWFFWAQQRGPWMFCEPDTVPMRSSWLDELEDEYLACRKRFMATFIPGVIGQYASHASGNMILPANASELESLMMPKIMRVGERDVEVAFDIAGAAEVLRDFHETKLIQQIFRGATFDNAADLERVRPETALFHNSKDGSLIRLLREKRSIPVEIVQPSPELPHEPEQPVAPQYGVVHAFYDNIGNAAEQEWLLARWSDTWRRKNGWSPKVIGLNEAKGHSHYEEFAAFFASLPTVNPAAYEFACWIRWVAMIQVGGGLMVDYDVMAYDWFPQDCPLPEGEYPTILSDRNPCPCAVYGTAMQYENMVHLMMEKARDCITVERGQPHISDQWFVQVHEKELRVADICQQYGKPEAETAHLVHYSNGSCQGRSRSVVIPKAEERRGLAQGDAKMQTVKDHVAALVELSKKDKMAKGRIVKQLRAAQLIR